MNALVTFRANTAGNLTPTTAQRAAAAETLTASLRAKLSAALRARAAKSDDAAAATAAKSATAAKADSASESDTLDRDAFLQLLVIQMQNQDPMNPMDNTAMVAQLAQFAALEQMTTLNTQFQERMELLTGNVDQANFIAAQGLLDKYVEGITSDGEFASGMVDAVTLSGSIVLLRVDGKIMPMTGVLAIFAEAPADPSDPTAETEDAS